MKLNIEQRKMIELEPSGHMLIKGVAGSGKTSVAVRRMKFLQEHYCPERDDRILLVTFNKTLLKYIKFQYENLQNDEEMLEQNLFSNTNKADIKNIDQIMYRYFKLYQKRHQLSLEIVSDAMERQTIQQAILKLQEEYQNIKVLSLKNQNFLLDEIAWIKACDIPDLETYQGIDRIGRANGGDGTPQKLTKNSETRAAIYHLMELYDSYLRHHEFVDFKTMNQIALQEVTEGDHYPYTHIIIDESQDLSKVQLKFLKALHADKSYASLMFVADNTQSIYSQSWLGKGRPYTTLGYDMSGKARTLSKNYRTTTEISKAAYSLIENDEQIKGNIDYVAPSLIDRHGHAPIYQFFMNEQNQAEFLLHEIYRLQSEYALKDICIIARNQRLIDNVQQSLEQANIPCEELRNNEPKFAANSVKLTTMHSIKGLEFKVIFLVHLDENVIPNQAQTMMDDGTVDTEERKLLYVGMTRANELLYMSSIRRPSSFIKDIDNNLLRMKKGAVIRPFRSISIQDYQLTEQIPDLNGREEVIRQWLLHQLVKTYGYPTELMTLEYPVQLFSQRGYVDIAISIEQNGKQIPYIFAEVKAFGQGIDTGIDQLNSYLATNETVRYGIVTDGVDLKIVNRNMEEILDIPPCQAQFLPNTKQAQTYLNLRNRNTYQYVQELDDPEHVDIVDTMTGLTLDTDIDQPIPLIGNVAAGIPITAIEAYEDTILLPNEWLIDSDNTFALRVTGDSMIDMDIEIGDIAIVNKQETAANGDIVIALINQEAAMKEFMVMGSTILLLSKNTNYEPIHMDPEDIIINGKVIGILKTPTQHSTV